MRGLFLKDRGRGPGSSSQGQRGNIVEKKDKGFKGLIVWQKAYALALDIYKASKKFPKDEMYGLVSQMRRAAVSIPANISEGYERNHRKEYVQFLFVSKGSLVTKESKASQNG
jgi:hypothetical protein